MRRNFLRILSIIMVFSVVFSSVSGMLANAAEVQMIYGENSELTIEVSATKSKFNWGEDVVFDAKVTNPTSNPVYYIDVLSEAKHTKWFSLSSAENTYDIACLLPGETQTVQIAFESENLSFITRFFVMPFIMIFDMFKSFSFDKERISTKESVKIGWFSYDFGFGIEYSNVGIDLSDCVYDSETGTYYLFSSKSALNGVISDISKVSGASYAIKDANGSALCSGEIPVEHEWSAPDIGFIVGENSVEITLSYTDNSTETINVKIHNLHKENMDILNLDMDDNDGDGVLNYIENLYKTDPDNADSDGDNLSDYDEMAILTTNPSSADSDKNNLTDDLSDTDNDGVSNYDEIYVYDTNPIIRDTDGDGVSDGLEITEYKSSPANTDTDGDGADDCWEVINGFDPTNADSDFNGKAPEGITDIAADEGVEVTVVIDDPFLDEQTPGYMGVAPYNINLGDVSSTEISIPFDNSVITDEDNPTIHFFNEVTQQYEEVPTTITEDGRAVATVNKDGKYILLNRRYVEDVWENDIVPPSTQTTGNGNIDIAFVIDRSASMDSNDPDRKRIAVIKEFVTNMRENDKASIIQFTAIAETIMPLTNDKEALINAADNIQNSDGGGCTGSDSNAGTNGAAGINNALDELEKSTAQYKYVIFLTDGADTVEIEADAYKNIIDEANGNITIHTVGLVGTGDVNIELLEQIADGTGGKYYLATTGANAEIVPEGTPVIEDVYKDIENITIDRHTDSNGDGISDYYTKLICEGVLTTTKGTSVFCGATFEEVQQNADYDGDGLLNGEEVVVSSGKGGVYAKIFSYPYMADSDNDTLSDKEEKTTFGTSALTPNSYVNYNNVKYTTNKDNFVSTQYLELYEENIFERGSVYIGNAFFGSTLDQTSVYQKELVSFFENITKNEEIILEKKNNQALMASSLDAFFAAAAEGMQKAETEEEFNVIKDLLVSIVETSKEVLNPSEELFGEKSKWAINMINYADKSKVTYYTNLANDYLKNSQEFIIPETWSKEMSTNYLSRISEKYLDATTKSDALNKKISIKNARFEKIMGGVNVVLIIGNAVTNGIEAYHEFNRVMANMETLKNNIDILDSVINTAQSNLYLKDAALNLRSYLYATYCEDSSKIDKFLMEFDYAMPVMEGVALDIFHSMVSFHPAGAVMELVRFVGNLAFNLDEISLLATQTVANASSANIISQYYINQLGYVDNEGEIQCVNNARTDGERIVAFTDFSEQLCKYLADIAIIRISAEKRMKEMNEGNSYVANLSDANQSKCNSVITHANVQLLLYYKALSD